ncbi:pyrroline-5-carboxylate reductase [Shewanella xiamenensis]|uniref:pyrroline-5-carboxylate reductase n=1 Tax=Shewanella TaxID=22 RepID=UPI000646CCE2|nr:MULTISPECIES: pyrroline-5-carboxylate reductase [Shewanella]MCT8860289.1 pyrroline-5-carboxylate reductase [Shewanella xiamenensis]MDN5499026.1 pyrroline-5-carboxylate reductase [Shewanella sp.]MDN5528503.1 pyrroline-5-carboxylate reductase [Shewanella sp.]NSM23670.1 pyrroline-5-carboxylate reductase [Shewanella sp. ZOR0012]UWG63602.1 pyrroline-5-carboxylate reductase [Shewanella xiamenensis]
MSQQKICFIGAGNMTRSIISGLIRSGYPASQVQATNPSQGKLDALAHDFGVRVSQDNVSAAQDADVIVLSVKPQLMEQVCQALQDIDMSNKLIITIAAGIKAERYSQYLAQPITLVRTMPNTPMQIGVGMTGLYAPQPLSDAQKAITERLMSSGGEIVWVNEESEINQVIALAGSSPAYFFLLMESMIDAGKQMGMDEAKARSLVQQAALGAAMMAKQNPELTLGNLRENVTSKGGTTAQAIATFEAADLRGVVKNAMENCINRAEEMAKTF